MAPLLWWHFHFLKIFYFCFFFFNQLILPAFTASSLCCICITNYSTRILFFIFCDNYSSLGFQKRKRKFYYAVTVYWRLLLLYSYGSFWEKLCQNIKLILTSIFKNLRTKLINCQSIFFFYVKAIFLILHVRSNGPLLL